MSANRHQHKSGGGNSQESAKTRPRYSTISPSSGQAYLTAARRYCLENLSEVVSTFCRGTVPIEMLEVPLSFDKINMLGRKAFKYHDAKGQLMTKDQTVVEWRTQVIKETRVANGNCTQAEALELLFPVSGKKARETKRQSFASQSLQLMHNLNLLWPSEAIILEMEKNLALRSASNCQDLIAWENAFTSFCLDNCGNPDMNVRAAEDTLESTFMKGHDLNAYVRTFRVGYNNVRQCKSTFTERRIVELFIRNLNQSQDAFFSFSRRILDESDPLYALVAQPLESAITYVENFFKSVIVPEMASAKRIAGQSASVKSVKDLKNLLDSQSTTGSTHGPVSVPYPVLAAMLKSAQNKNNNNPMNDDSKESRKRKFPIDKVKEDKNPAANTDANAGTAAPDAKKPKAKKTCYNFPKGTCEHGDKCRFSHALTRA